MPLYEYACPTCRKVEAKLRGYGARHDVVECAECKQPMPLIISGAHIVPDGVYSYAPNIGSADAFERRQLAIHARKKDGGPRVIPKIR